MNNCQMGTETQIWTQTTLVTPQWSLKSFYQGGLRVLISYFVQGGYHQGVTFVN